MRYMIKRNDGTIEAVRPDRTADNEGHVITQSWLRNVDVAHKKARQIYTPVLGNRPNGKYYNVTQDAPTYDEQADEIRISFTSTLKNADALKDIRKAEVKQLRDQKMSADFSWSPDGGATTYVFQADERSRSRMDQEVQGLNLSADTTTQWRMTDDTWVELSAADFKAAALALRARVKACYAKQAEHEQGLKSAALTSNQAVMDHDITTGWPD